MLNFCCLDPQKVLWRSKYTCIDHEKRLRIESTQRIVKPDSRMPYDSQVDDCPSPLKSEPEYPGNSREWIERQEKVVPQSPSHLPFLYLSLESIHSVFSPRVERRPSNDVHHFFCE